MNLNDGTLILNNGQNGHKLAWMMDTAAINLLEWWTQRPKTCLNDGHCGHKLAWMLDTAAIKITETMEWLPNKTCFLQPLFETVMSGTSNLRKTKFFFHLVMPSLKNITLNLPNGQNGPKTKLIFYDPSHIATFCICLDTTFFRLSFYQFSPSGRNRSKIRSNP